MCCYIISVTFAFFQKMKTHTTPSTKHAAHTPGNLDMPETRKGSEGKTIKTLPKLRVSNNLTCFPIPWEMTKLSSATVTMSRTRTVEAQKCHFVYRLVTNVLCPRWLLMIMMHGMKPWNRAITRKFQFIVFLGRLQVSTDCGHFVYNVNLYHVSVYRSVCVSVCLSDIYQLLLYYGVYINVQNVISVRSWQNVMLEWTVKRKRWALTRKV